MRILHFADVHIGVENYGTVDPETGLSTRLGDFLSSYDEVVSYALDTRVDLVLFCGDAYKSRDPSQTHQREFVRRVARLASAGIPVFLVAGNHDMPHVIGRATALEIFPTLAVPNVYIADSLKTYRVVTPAGLLQVVAVPWISRGAFLEREEARGLTPDQVNEAIQERLARVIKAQADSLDKSIPAVLAAHLSVGEAKTSSEQSMMLGRDHVLPRSSVALPEFDYVALGHVHRQQVLGHTPPVVYSGSLERIDFGEEKDEKGFYVVGLDPRKPAGLRLQEFQFHRVNARSFLTVAVKIPVGDPDPTRTVVEALSGYYFQDAIMRVQITVPGELEGLLRLGEVRRALEGAYYVASISREVVTQPRMRLGPASAKGLEPRQALQLYLESRNVPKDRAELLVQRAGQLMADEVP